MAVSSLKVTVTVVMSLLSTSIAHSPRWCLERTFEVAKCQELCPFLLATGVPSSTTDVPAIYPLSYVAVKDNLVKNILFRASAIALQYAILKFCAYVAYLKSEYTSFLMFAEDLIQQTLFIASRGVQRSATIVFIFAVSFTLAGLYDTLLWALDSPGHVVRSKLVSGSVVTPDLLQNPSYVSIISDPNNDLNVDANEALTTELFRPGFNFSFPTANYIQTPGAILPPPPLDPTTGMGPRIHLDAEGFGAGFGPPVLGDGRLCNTTLSQDASTASWWCRFPGNSSQMYLDKPIGQPAIWWDNDISKTTYLTPHRTDNPWVALGIRAEGGVMKQVFTLTKGNWRHTFLQTTLKANIGTTGSKMIPEEQIVAVLRRFYTTFGYDSSVADEYAQRCIDEQANRINSTTMGFMAQYPANASIRLTTTDFINDIAPTDKRVMGFLRFMDVSIALVRSETIAEPVQPIAPCDVWNYNEATGGRARWNSCLATSSTNQSEAHFMGQVDTSAVAVIVDILGDAGNETNTGASNIPGERWYLSNRERIDQLLLSRAFLTGGDTNSVRVVIYNNEPAISHLQLLLVILPFILAFSAFILMVQDKRGYYKSSLFASLVATTHIGTRSCNTVSYFRTPPTLVLWRLDHHIRIGTKDGSIIMSSEEGPEKGHVEADGAEVVVPPKDELAPSTSESNASVSHVSSPVDMHRSRAFNQIL